MGKTTRISATEAKNRFGEIIKRAAYGGERFIVESHGKALVDIVVHQEEAAEPAYTPHDDDVLERLRVLREEGAKYGRGVKFSSLEEIRRLRDGEDGEFPDQPR